MSAAEAAGKWTKQATTRPRDKGLDRCIEELTLLNEYVAMCRSFNQRGFPSTLKQRKRSSSSFEKGGVVDLMFGKRSILIRKGSQSCSLVFDSDVCRLKGRTHPVTLKLVCVRGVHQAKLALSSDHATMTPVLVRQLY